LLGADLGSDRAKMRRSLSELLDAGVTHILDTRSEWSDEGFVAALAPEILYSSLGVDDAGVAPDDQWFDLVTQSIDEALADPSARVCVLCHVGINRGPSAVFAHLLSSGTSIAAAMDVIREAREVANAYDAEDALEWWIRRMGHSGEEADRARFELRSWRDAN